MKEEKKEDKQTMEVAVSPPGGESEGKMHGWVRGKPAGTYLSLICEEMSATAASCVDVEGNDGGDRIG